MPLKCVGQFFLHPGPHPFKASSILKLHQPVQEDRQIRTMQPRTDSSKNTGRHKKGLKTTNKNATNIMLIVNNGQNLMEAVLNCQTPRTHNRQNCSSMPNQLNLATKNSKFLGDSNRQLSKPSFRACQKSPAPSGIQAHDLSVTKCLLCHCATTAAPQNGLQSRFSTSSRFSPFPDTTSSFLKMQKFLSQEPVL